MSDEEGLIQIGVVTPLQNIHEWLIAAVMSELEYKILRIANTIMQFSPEGVNLLIITEGEMSLPGFVNYLEHNSIRGGIYISDDIDSIHTVVLQSQHSIGLLAFDASQATFLATLKSVSAGYHVLPVARSSVTDRTNEVEPLSRRELEVLSLVVSGMSNQQISEMLHFSQNTVKYHLTNIYLKIGVVRRSEAIRVAITKGLMKL